MRIRVELVGASEESISVEADIAMRKAATNIARDVVRPILDAGPIGDHVTITPVAGVQGQNKYVFELKVPRRYMAVETGTGVFGPSGVPFIVKPKNAKALLIATGDFIAHAEVQGQRSQPSIYPALEAARKALPKEFFKELRYGLARRRASRGNR